MPLGRLEAFSDGVFRRTCCARSSSSGPPTSRTSQASLTIGAIWLEHSAVTSVLRVGDAALFRINLVVLLLVGFLPLPTSARR